MTNLSSSTVAADVSVRELSFDEIEFVAGAGELNPQPLPPGPGPNERFNYRSFASLFSSHSFNFASIFNHSFSFFH